MKGLEIFDLTIENKESKEVTHLNLIRMFT